MIVTIPARTTGSLLRIACLAGFLASLFISFPVKAEADTFLETRGDYEVVAIRRAGGVAGSAGNPLAGPDSPIGQEISIDADGLHISGLACDAWNASSVDPAPFGSDPILRDYLVPALPEETIPRMQAYRIDCEGEYFTTVIRSGNRSLAMTWLNETVYLILQKPLSDSQFRRLAKSLADMKFLHGDSDKSDRAEIMTAARDYYEYRMGKSETGTPDPVVLSEGLLSGLGVID